MPSVRTQRFRAVVGVLSGYASEEITDDLVESLRDRAARLLVVVGCTPDGCPSVVIESARCVHSRSPANGEPVLVISGTYNPARPHGRTQENWKQAVLDLFEAYRREARQRTVQVEFDEVELHYLADPDNAREGAPDDSLANPSQLDPARGRRDG